MSQPHTSTFNTHKRSSVTRTSPPLTTTTGGGDGESEGGGAHLQVMMKRSCVTSNLSGKKATPPQPAKKLVIKLLKAKPTLPTNFEENTWTVLKSAISAIFLKQPDFCDLEKLYQAVNDLCLHKMGEVFTNGLKRSVKPTYMLLYNL